MRQIIILIFMLQNLNSMYIRDDDAQTILNTSTMLVWQDDSEAETITKKWSEAIDYCENLTLASKSDWRLPNINELNTIIDDSRSNPSINVIFQNVASSRYWSSTTYHRPSYFNQAWYINFYDSKIQTNNKTSVYNVRCIRDIK